METKNNHIFLETMILSILILIGGFVLGFSVESWRTNKVINETRTFEIEALDLKLQNYYYQIMDDASCQEAITQNFIFADDLYNRGLILEKYELANQLSEDITREKKRYVLLKTELWLNSLLLKNKCGGENKTFHTLVYFYSNERKDLVKNSKQLVFANILKQLKEEEENNLILLPLAGDLNLSSVDLQRRVYNITTLPSILIDEKIVLTEIPSVEELETYLKN